MVMHVDADAVCSRSASASATRCSAGMASLDFFMICASCADHSSSVWYVSPMSFSSATRLSPSHLQTSHLERVHVDGLFEFLDGLCFVRAALVAMKHPVGEDSGNMRLCLVCFGKRNGAHGSIQERRYLGLN